MEKLQEEMEELCQEDPSLETLINCGEQAQLMGNVIQNLNKDQLRHIQEKANQQEVYSRDFWNKNKEFESELDNLIAQLQAIDQNVLPVLFSNNPQLEGYNS